MVSGTTQEPNKAQGMGGPSSLAQGSSVPRFLFRLHKEAWDPKASTWSERVLAQDLGASTVAAPPGWRCWWDAVVPRRVNP